MLLEKTPINFSFTFLSSQHEKAVSLSLTIKAFIGINACMYAEQIYNSLMLPLSIYTYILEITQFLQLQKQVENVRL